MVLASQTPRQTNPWRSMTNERRRKRSKGRLLLIVGTLATLGVATWAIFLRSPAEVGPPGESESPGASSESPLGGSPPPPANSPAADAIRGGRRESDRPTGRASSQPSDSRGSTAADTPRERSGPETVISMGGDEGQGRGGQPGASERATARRPTAEPSPEPTRESQPASGASGPASGKGPQAEPSTGSRGITPEPLSAAIALAERDPVAARRQLSAMVEDPRYSPAERAKARETISAINRRILLSPVVLPNDPLVRTYTVQSGDSLQRIARTQGMGADWRLLKRINGIEDERRLKVGQTLKVVPGTFHAVVDKLAYRMDVFLVQADEQGSERRTFVCSLPVGLGELNSTPTGRFKVRPGSRLVNPAWTNPRTGEHFKADDPKNPIGEFWIGLQGIDKSNEAIEKIGIHGTIDPSSIGRQLSMGCVRLAAPDIALVYELITDPGSVVEIREGG